MEKARYLPAPEAPEDLALLARRGVIVCPACEADVCPDCFGDECGCPCPKDPA